MNISLLLLIYLVGAIATFASGKNNARTVAIVISFIGAIFWLVFYGQIQSATVLTESYTWIDSLNIKLSFLVDGLSYNMLGLCALLLPIILLTTNQQQFKNAHIIYSLVLFMTFAMCGTFMAIDGFLYYIFWELALIPIFLDRKS